VLVLALGVWGGYNELNLVRSTMLKAEISQLRTQAVRRVGHLESGLERFAPNGDLQAMADSSWLQLYWKDILPSNPKYLYTAIVDLNNIVVLHSKPALQGQRLEQHWYDRIARDAGSDVYEVMDSILSDNKHAYDIRVPILMNDREIGGYHEGLSAAWFNEATADRERAILWRWVAVIGGILIVVIAATASLLSLARRSLFLGEQVHLAKFQHLDQVEKLAGGIVHEIRNPLHAFRLNLHALRRMHEGRAEFSQEEVTAILEESNREIERVERLLQELLGYACPDKPREETIDVASEVRSTLNFLNQDLTKSGVEVHADIENSPLLVHMDSGRLRQVMLNLLMNAKDVVPGKGNIFVKVAGTNAKARITVTDNGPGIKQKNITRVFDPFFSTKKNGSGLGLAIVKRFVEEVNGTITVASNGQGGASFCVELPEASRNNRKGKS
jgi:signal transduction histidine kinase